MTGFGAATGNFGKDTLRIEVHSVNQKGLVVQVNGPREWPGVEVFSQKLLKEKFVRGKFQITLRVELSSAPEAMDRVDTVLLKNKLQTFCSLATEMGIDSEPTAEVFYQMIKDAGPANVFPAWESVEDTVAMVLSEALQKLETMRKEEGARLKVDFKNRMSFLAKAIVRIGELDRGRVQRYRDLLLSRLEQMDLELDPTDERVLKEISLFADRCDISEELTRLTSHLTAFTDSMDADSEGVGRRMEFILQEMHRETNTIGSKANDSALSSIVMEVKQELEKVREQAANIE